MLTAHLKLIIGSLHPEHCCCFMGETSAPAQFMVHGNNETYWEVYNCISMLGTHKDKPGSWWDWEQTLWVTLWCDISNYDLLTVCSHVKLYDRWMENSFKNTFKFFVLTLKGGNRDCLPEQCAFLTLWTCSHANALLLVFTAQSLWVEVNTLILIKCGVPSQMSLLMWYPGGQVICLWQM